MIFFPSPFLFHDDRGSEWQRQNNWLLSLFQALAEAIRSVTEFNPDMSVERIECVQQIEEVKDK